jgi:transcriptional regulator with XRE-family HTH domain
MICNNFVVRKSLDVQLAKYLRKARGELSYAQFSKKVGISHTTLHRIERGEHHLTLHKLDTILTKLKARLSDIFPEEF